jgi:hypothetical protein
LISINQDSFQTEHGHVSGFGDSFSIALKACDSSPCVASNSCRGVEQSAVMTEVGQE